MPSASAIRLQIESALATRIPSALTPAARIMRPVSSTGIEVLDEALNGGLPVGAITELIGPECSGRTSVALAFVACMTQAGRVCAWIDVSNALDPASAAAAGVDLRRLLWVRCGSMPQKPSARITPSFTLPEKYLVPAPAQKGLHGGGCGGHPRGEMKGMAGAVRGLMQQANITPRCAEAQRRDGSSLGVSAVKDSSSAWSEKSNPTGVIADKRPAAKAALTAGAASSSLKAAAPTWPGAIGAKPWARLDQALRAADLLLQGGGFGAIVLDLGGLAPEFASRVPLATWFRYRAAAESSQVSLLLLAQYGCAKSSAELTLRLEPGDALDEEPTLFTGMEHGVEVVRRRFRGAQDNVVPLRKPPQRANAARWQSHAVWAGVR